jgi:hypothetical protein
MSLHCLRCYLHAKADATGGKAWVVGTQEIQQDFILVRSVHTVKLRRTGKFVYSVRI